MKTLIRLVLIFVFVSACGLTNKAKPIVAEHDKASVTNKQVSPIQSVFFRSTFGDEYLTVYYRLLKSYGKGMVDQGINMPVMAGLNVKRSILYKNLSFGGYSWDYTNFMFDHADRFFAICFANKFDTMSEADKRYLEIVDVYNSKYGNRTILDQGSIYSDEMGRNVIIVDTKGEDCWLCDILYVDQRLYDKDSKALRDEL